MTDSATSLPAGDRPQPSGAARLALFAASPQQAWHAAWALAVAAAAALFMIVFGGASGASAGALLAGAAPGLIGWVWRAEGKARLGLLAIWTVAAVAAGATAGGPAGPLASWTLAPLLASGALGGLWAEGAAATGAAALALILFAALRVAPPPVAGVQAALLGCTGIVALVAGAAGLSLRLPGLASRAPGAEAAPALAGFEILLQQLPVQALVLHRDGTADAAFGDETLGVPESVLAAEGLLPGVLPEDQGRVRACLGECLDHGHAACTFRSASPHVRTLRAEFRRMSDGRIAAALRPAPVETSADPELRARTLQAEAERDAALKDRDRAEAATRARARFLANMSHELRTPLNAIMGFSDIMRTQLFGPMPERYADYAQLIHESGAHLLDLVNDVLDMSKIEAERFTLSREVFDLRDAVGAALRLMRLQAEDARVQLRTVLPPDPLTVDADRRAVKQIVLNLVSNALKFTPEGGVVTVSVARSGADLVIGVADTGVGIAPEDLRRLGRPFEQAGDAPQRVQGAGLGLSLVRAMAALHGGTMTLESQLGEGTAVTVRLPVLAEAGEAAA